MTYSEQLEAREDLLVAARVIAKSGSNFDQIKADRMEKLRDAIDRYEKHGGTYRDSPKAKPA